MNKRQTKKNVNNFLDDLSDNIMKSLGCDPENVNKTIRFKIEKQDIAQAIKTIRPYTDTLLEAIIQKDDELGGSLLSDLR